MRHDLREASAASCRRVIRFVPINRWELHEVEPRLHQPQVADEHVDALLDPLRHTRLAALRRDRVGLHHRHPEAGAAEEVLHPPGDVARARVRRVDEYPASRQPLGGDELDELDERLLLRVKPLPGEGWHLHEQGVIYDGAGSAYDAMVPLRVRSSY